MEVSTSIIRFASDRFCCSVLRLSSVYPHRRADGTGQADECFWFVTAVPRHRGGDRITNSRYKRNRLLSANERRAGMSECPEMLKIPKLLLLYFY